MSEGYRVDLEQIRAHAGKLEAIRARFEAVKTASAHIAQDDEAYGLLCGWISAVLEGRHTRQDELIAFVEENLSLASADLLLTADEYGGAEESHSQLLRSLSEGVGDD
ncbi:hypothetical protein [Amycolatopsis sp. 195334CR]|uniref:hypothetical protein n=1 Tax=Amycolatopsis sp. 195334CR TaxID=2814588 RepID=UPI001A8F66D3|nr:hypothetical protein [Amycolatopsis sp. 195334CR]MBN6039106.1 hypothetical protein [Amycolatopsis sp. 195334CR]